MKKPISVIQTLKKVKKIKIYLNLIGCTKKGINKIRYIQNFKKMVLEATPVSCGCHDKLLQTC